jgi:hypothetical protein
MVEEIWDFACLSMYIYSLMLFLVDNMRYFQTNS